MFEQLHLEVLARNSAVAAKAKGEVDALVRAFDDFLTAVLEPDVRRIMIEDAPSVLGLQRFTEMDERYAFSAIVDVLNRANAGGELNVAQPEALAHLLLGALVRGGMLIANSSAPRKTRDSVSATLRDLLQGLAPPKMNAGAAQCRGAEQGSAPRRDRESSVVSASAWPAAS